VPIEFLSDGERERLDRFPAQVLPGDIEAYFSLSRADRKQIPLTASPANRLGFALRLGTLRFLGFCSDDLSAAPEAVIAFVARQLDVAPGELTRYGRRGQTGTEHLRQIREYLGFRKATAGGLSRLENWLVDRALEHDRPSLLLRRACEHLRGLRIERPGVTNLERLIAAARQRAQHETHRRLAPILTGDCQAQLDGLLSVDPATGRSYLAWLQQSVASDAPPTILVTLEKRDLCRRWGIDRWDLFSLSPNRLKFLAQIARRSTHQALRRMPEQRRYPILGRLNKGEALHALREFLLFSNKATFRRKQEEELRNQAGCLNLVTNAVATWNTVYMAAVIERLRSEGKTVNDEDIARLSPARYEHINPYGKHRFEVQEGLSRTRLRSLRPPTEHSSG
jgi:TnpA family transposase